MHNSCQAVTPPAYGFLKWAGGLCLRAFQRIARCPHSNPSFPIAGKQECPDCGAWRDYIFSPRWQREYVNLLSAYCDGYLSRADFQVNVHARLRQAEGVFIGEWREGVYRA